MPQAADIVLADAAGTPVNHTFVPVGLDAKGNFWFEDQSQPAAIGFWQISLMLKRPPPAIAGTKSDNRVYRATVGLHEPILANITNSTVTGVEPSAEIAYIPRSVTEYVLPERGVLLDRKNIRKMSYNLQNNAQVVDLVENLLFPR